MPEIKDENKLGGFERLPNHLKIKWKIEWTRRRQIREQEDSKVEIPLPNNYILSNKSFVQAEQ